MEALFRGCTSLTFLPDISKWNTNKIKDMSYMFSDCESLTSIDLSSFNTNNVTDMKYMFRCCGSLKIENIKIKISDKKILNEFNQKKI